MYGTLEYADTPYGDSGTDIVPSVTDLFGLYGTAAYGDVTYGGSADSTASTPRLHVQPATDLSTKVGTSDSRVTVGAGSDSLV